MARLITLDFETFYSKEYSLTKLNTEAYVRDERFQVIGVSAKVNDQVPTWFSGTHDQVAAWLHDLDIPSAFLLAHNTAFDGFILSHHFGIKPRFYIDTMSMARPLHAQTCGVSLKALSDHYTVGVKGDEVILAMGKRLEDFSPVELANYGRYCMNDTQLTYILFQILKKELPAAEIQIIDLILRMFIDPVLELDAELLTEHLKDVKEKKEKLLATVEQVAGQDVLRSNPKFAVLLQQLGVDPPRKPSPANPAKMTYAFSKTDTAFKELLQHEDPRVQAVVSARLGVRSTIEETRTQSFLGIASRGTLPVPLGYYKAHTGRAAGEDGINLQNLPSRGGNNALRRAIRAPEGYVLIDGDSAQIEARILAWLSGQIDLVEDFRRGVDIYSHFACDVYGRPIDRKRKEIGPDGKEFEPDKAEGFVGKESILSLGFGVGHVKLQHSLQTKGRVHLELDETRRIVNLYRDKYKRIPKLWNAGEDALHAMTKGQQFAFGTGKLLRTSEEGIHLPNGMMVRYPSLVFNQGRFAYARDRRQQAAWVRQKLTGVSDLESLTSIYGAKVIENVVQALARIVVFGQMLTVAQVYRVVLTVHDSIVACVPARAAAEAKDYMTRVMSVPPQWALDLPIACEVKVGNTYGDAK